jgi:hypothetical protein
VIERCSDPLISDATYLVTTVSIGRRPAITNNKHDFPSAITEIHVTYPANRAGPANSDISTVEDMFDELVRRGGNPVREVAAALRAMGYVPAVPERMGDKPREVYLGWADPARDYARGKFTLSLDARTVWFRQQDDQKRIQDMPGAYPTGSYVGIRISVSDGVAHATAAARQVKR